MTLLTSPHLIDAIIILTVLEAAGLALWHRRTGQGLSLRRIVPVLLPGVFVMVALRAALAGTPWPWVPAALLASLAAHLIDLHDRWNR